MRRSLSTALALFAGLALGVHEVRAQDVDLSGAWTLTVRTDQGVTTPTWNLTQEGTRLTGRYSSEALGQNDVTGSVEGGAITISFEANLQGQGVPVVYRGTLQDDGTLAGTIDVAGGMLTGSFTARRFGG